MGHSKVIPIILRRSKTKQYIAPWNIKTDGEATSDNIGKWRDGFNQSLLDGGANAHLGINHWLQCGLELYNQITKEVLATYTAPMFEVIP